MAFFEEIDSKELFDEDECFPPFTDEELKETEKAIGWKLPKSYIALLNMQNGCRINVTAFDES